MWLMPDRDITIRAEICEAERFGTASFRLPGRAKSIGESAFSGIAAKVVYVPGNNSEEYPIGAKAFANCPNLTQIRLPRQCRIAESAFWGCPNLTTIYAPAGGSTEKWATDNGYGFRAE